jgi:hypothetical protein
MSVPHHRYRIFLLSPANLAGIKARRIMADNAQSGLACRLRAAGVPLGELFSFVSSLYFRGKLSYAEAFAAPPPKVPGSFVITSDAGLLPPDTLVTHDRVREIAANDIDPGNPKYRDPLCRDCHALSEALQDAGEVVLLGSIATAKYVEPLLEIFRERLLFPTDFVGRGDMSRGGLMLRCVNERKELQYVPVLNATLHGAKPPKLLPAMRNPVNISFRSPTPVR